MTVKAFNDFKEFENEAEKLGVEEDLRALLTLDANFMERYKNYVVVNLKDYGPEPNNLMVLSYETALLYSTKQLGERDFSLFRFTIKKKFGESTVLALLVMRKVLESYNRRFEELNAEIDKLEAQPVIEQLESVARYLRKLTDRVEDFIEVLIKLEERRIREVNTQYVSYDWDILTTEAQHLLDRCRRRLSLITGLRSEMDIHSTLELNKRIEVLTDIMKKLTSITVILMIPNVVGSHFGMNFKFMPELSVDWAYPAVIIIQIALAVGAALYFRKKGWL